MKAFILALLLCVATPALALEQYNDSFNFTTSMVNEIKNYVDTPPGAVDWKVLGKTKEIDVEGKTSDGMDFQYFKPGFSPEALALDGQKVTLKGFMFPLQEDDKQTEFLFGPFPLSCPYHYHVGPALVVEVHSEKAPITFTYDPMTVTGTLQLVKKDMENSTFYRLLDAREVK